VRKLIVFNSVSLDGYFTDAKGDISWAHKHDPEWNDFVGRNVQSGGELMFGRVTYEMMASYWPTPQAMDNDPEVAEGMNNLPKVVFSRTLDEATWENTRLFKGNLAEEVRKLKAEPGDQLVLMGSGSIVSQLTDERLIDEYQCVLNPIVLGGGRTMFDGIKDPLNLELRKTRAFQNGNMLLCHQLK